MRQKLNASRPLTSAAITRTLPRMTAIAILGGGAIGCFYAAQFITAGHDVRLLLRSNYEHVRDHGLTIHQTRASAILSTQNSERLDIPASAFNACSTVAECLRSGPVDFVLLAIKTTAVHDLKALLAPFTPLPKPVIALCNGLGFEDRIAHAIDARRIVGALAFICVNRDDDGSIRHQAHGSVEIGHFCDDASGLPAIANVFRSSGITARISPCLLEARWRKLAWNIPFNGLGATQGMEGVDTEAILRDRGMRDQAEQLMSEVIAVANADLEHANRPGRIDPKELIPDLFKRTESMGKYLTSTVLDMRQGRPMEIEFLFAEPVQRAQKLGIKAPMMTGVLEKLLMRQRGATVFG
jgi:2-dehydropantoate 2-reductase